MEPMTLKGICAELKIDPRVAREKLRTAIREPKKYPNLAKAHKPRQPWQWTKRSSAEKEGRAALTTPVADLTMPNRAHLALAFLAWLPGCQCPYAILWHP